MPRCRDNPELSLPHALSCPKGRYSIARHDALVDLIYRWLVARKICVMKEVVVSDESKDRIDLLVTADGVRYWCDVVVAEPGVPSYVKQACKEEGAAAKIVKRSAWRLLKPHDVELYPLSFESTGRVGASLSEFLHQMEKSSSCDHSP